MANVIFRRVVAHAFNHWDKVICEFHVKNYHMYKEMDENPNSLRMLHNIAKYVLLKKYNHEYTVE